MYRVRRMYLVNAGTNRQKPSRRISEVDPRDGAAVVGPNGVGKTTTLRLAPLFLGHLPSQIIQAGHGQKTMARFILPTPESAIVFEYQRGRSETHDIRLAVLRARRDNPDSIEYRLFECAFQRALFLDDSGTFLDDEGSTVAARDLGYNYSPKLTTSDYRSVILNLRSQTKDASRLRQLAREYSFAPKPMPNLDRLVAAVVKEHVSFSDLIQVAVGMVHEQTGGSTASERNKLWLKQTRSEIHEWINNRRACQESLTLTPKVSEISTNLERLTKEETEIRILGAEVRALGASKSSKLTEAIKQREEVERARSRAVQEEEQIHQQLRSGLELAQATQRKAAQDYEDQEFQRVRFAEGKATEWAKKEEGVPQLNAEREQIIREQNIYEAAYSEAKTGIDNEINAAKDEVLELRDRDLIALDGVAEAAESAYGVESQVLGTQKDEALEGARKRHAEQQSMFERNVTQNKEKLSRARALSERVEGPPDLREAVEVIRAEVDELRDKHQEAIAFESARRLDLASMRAEFSRTEREEIVARSELTAIKADLADLEAQLMPEEGTLLAEFHKHPWQDWASLAKLLAPEHLARTDLAPSFEGDKDNATAYGWSLDTEKLAAPLWADADDLRTQMAAQKQRLAVAQRHCEELGEKLEHLSERVSVASNELNVAEAASTLAKRNRDTKAHSLERAQLTLKQACDEELVAFRQQIGRLETEITQSERARNAASQAGVVELRTIAQLYDDKLWKLGTQRQAEIDSFKEKRAAIRTQADSDIRALEAQRRMKLRDADMDPDKIESWKVRLKGIAEELRAIRENGGLVEQWRAWMVKNGPATLLRLHDEFTQANTVLSNANKAYAEHESACRRTTDAYKAAASKVEGQVTELENECRKLQSLADELPMHFVQQVSFDANMSATEIAASVNRARTNLESTERRVEQLYKQVYNALIARESNVKDFVEKSISEVPNANSVDRAYALVKCHGKIPGDIVSNLNNTLRAVLDTIEHFYNAILGFETEIKRFNKALTDGLAAVRQFERVSGLQIEMVTDFSDLGFMDRLKAVSAFAASNHITLGRAGVRTTVPGVETEMVLLDFANSISTGGRLEVDLASHIRIRGRVIENGIEKSFQRESELENVSSNGLTSIILITLLIGMLNMIRGGEEVYVTWVTDEVGKFDGPNFVALMDMLRENRIDVITASPDLNPRHYRKFAQRYRFEDMGVIRMFAPQLRKGERPEEMEVSL